MSASVVRSHDGAGQEKQRMPHFSLLSHSGGDRNRPSVTDGEMLVLHGTRTVPDARFGQG